MAELTKRQRKRERKRRRMRFEKFRNASSKPMLSCSSLAAFLLCYEADPTKSGLHFARAKSLLCGRWAPATTTSRSRSSRRPPRDLEHLDFVQVGCFPISPLPDAELSAAHAWQDSSEPRCSKRQLAATRCPHLSPALHQPSPETRSDFPVLCVWRQQVWQH